MKMKTIIFCCILFLTTGSLLVGQSQPKNILGVSTGIVPAVNDMYFGSPYNFWPKRALSNIYQVFYARQIFSTVRIGAYFEYERVKFKAEPDPQIHNVLRHNIGVNALGQFPKTPLHMQLGGYLGFGSLNADQWDKLTGVDFGFIAGPAYEKNHCGAAIHVQTGYAGYTSSGIPEEVKLYNPKILLKLYYLF